MFNKASGPPNRIFLTPSETVTLNLYFLYVRMNEWPCMSCSYVEFLLVPHPPPLPFFISLLLKILQPPIDDIRDTFTPNCGWVGQEKSKRRRSIRKQFMDGAVNLEESTTNCVCAKETRHDIKICER